MRRSVLVLILLALASVSAFAVDGVVLLNQSVALAGMGGCDTPGFPITICNAGSYKLSGNLTVADANTDVIDVRADNVTVDLNGFTISGPVTCTKDTIPPPCSAGGTGIGVSGLLIVGKIATFYANVTVLNGVVRGMGSTGVLLRGEGSRAEGVHVESNHDDGLNVLGLVTKCTAVSNGGNGIYGDIVSYSSSSWNGGVGIRSNGVVSNNYVSVNGGDGIRSSGEVSYNVVGFNQGWGIVGDTGPLSVGIIGNNINANSAGAVKDTVNMGHNLCNGALCP